MVVQTVLTPVLTVRQGEPSEDTSPAADVRYTNILVATDGSDCANAVVEHGLNIARQYDATVHGLFVVDQRAYARRPGYTWDDVIEAWQCWGEIVLADFEKKTAAEVDLQTTV